MDVSDYLIDTDDLDWSELFAKWKWLIKPGTDLEPWLMNQFGDLFWVDAKGAIHWLNVTDGTDQILAANEKKFLKMIDKDDNANDWLMIPLVDELKQNRRKLIDGQCYAFKTLPVLGGDYDVENVYASSVADYWCFCGDVHEQSVDLPDGSRIEIELPKRKM